MSRSLICCDTHHSLDLKVPSGSSASGSGSRSGSVCSASSALPSGTLEVLWLDEIRGIRKLHLQLAVAPDLDDLANRSTRNKIMLATPCHCVSAPASPPRSIHHLPLPLSQGLDLRCCCRRLDLRLRAGPAAAAAAGGAAAAGSMGGSMGGNRSLQTSRNCCRIKRKIFSPCFCPETASIVSNEEVMKKFMADAS